MNWFIMCLIVSTCMGSAAYAEAIIYDFDSVMRPENYTLFMQKTKYVVGVSAKEFYCACKHLYTQHNHLLRDNNAQEKNVKIIHQIWLGSPVTGIIQEFVEEWQSFCAQQGWHYRLWTDSDIESLGLYNKSLYESTPNFGMKSDIARLEILHRFGGFYVDIDCQPLNAFDELLHFDFIIGLQPLSTGFLQLNNAFIGAVAGNPVLQRAIEMLEDNWIEHKGAPQKCGPVFLTRVLHYCFIKGELESTNSLVLPSLYLYPYLPGSNDIDLDQWRTQGSYIVHWWAKTWMPKKYRRAPFRTIANDTVAIDAWND